MHGLTKITSAWNPCPSHKQVSREIEIHASLLHPHIVRLYAAFEDVDGIYLVQEYAARGEPFQ